MDQYFAGGYSSILIGISIIKNNLLKLTFAHIWLLKAQQKQSLKQYRKILIVISTVHKPVRPLKDMVI